LSLVGRPTYNLLMIWKLLKPHARSGSLHPCTLLTGVPVLGVTDPTPTTTQLFSTQPAALNQEKSTCEVAWALAGETDKLPWSGVQPFTRNLPKSNSAKSVQVCPAAVDFDARYYVANCPLDLKLEYIASSNDQGEPKVLINGNKGSNFGLDKRITLLSMSQWRNSARPLLSVQTPWVFMSDDPVYINIFPPFMHFATPGLPGLVLNQRASLEQSPLNISWIFEWHEPSKPILIKKGDPWIYVHFEGNDPSRRVRLLQAELKA
jgi:hypothetical protein